MSRPRKQRISGFLSVLIWLWVRFAKRAMFWCAFRWVLSLLYPLLSPTSCRKIFKIFFRSYFYSFFLYLLFHQIKQICFEFIWNTSVKTNKQTNERTNKAKQKAANSVYFFSITLRITLQFSVYFCLFLFNTEQGGRELELSESLKRRNFLSGSQWPQSQN